MPIENQWLNKLDFGWRANLTLFNSRLRSFALAIIEYFHSCSPYLPAGLSFAPPPISVFYVIRTEGHNFKLRWFNTWPVKVTGSIYIDGQKEYSYSEKPKNDFRKWNWTEPQGQGRAQMSWKRNRNFKKRVDYTLQWNQMASFWEINLHLYGVTQWYCITMVPVHVRVHPLDSGEKILA